MSVLLKFKQWILLDEAAEYLSRELWEDITKADLLRLAIDGHLTLSVYLNNSEYGRPCKLVPCEKAKMREFSLPGLMKPGEEFEVLEGQLLNKDLGVIEIDEVNEAVYLSGIFDIPAWQARYGSGGFGLIEDELQSLEQFSLCGLYVESPEGVLHQILYRPKTDAKGTLSEPEDWLNITNFSPALRFTRDFLFALRTNELFRIEKELKNAGRRAVVTSDDTSLAAHAVKESNSYTTRLLTVQAEAIERFWVRYEPAEQDTAPDADAIMQWLIAKGCSKREAEAIDLIIRHDSRKKGGRTS